MSPRTRNPVCDLNSPPGYIAFGDRHFSLVGWQRVEQATAKVSWTFSLVTLCTQTMFSMLQFMCRDPGDTTSKVSCCVEPSQSFKNSDFDASVKVPLALRKLAWPKNMVNLKSASFIVIMLLDEGLTHIYSQNKPRLHFAESFTLRLDTRNPNLQQNC